MSDLAERKAKARQEKMAQRHLLPKERRDWVASEVLKYLKNGLSWDLFQHVGLYRSLGGEVPTDSLEQWLRGEGKTLYFPRTHPENHKIDMVQMGPGGGWVKSILGIMEPSPDLPAVKPDKLDLILVPGLAFDRSGHRLGRGKGCYDRWLKGFKGPKVALAYEFQMMEQVPVGPQDESVDGVVTEGGFYQVPKKI